MGRMRFLVAALGLSAQIYAQDLDTYPLRAQKFPHIRELEEESNDEAPGTQSLSGGVKDFSDEIGKSVRYMAQKRQFTCFKDPCHIQAFPLAYNQRHSGFFGGLRAKIINISQNDPYLYALDFNYVRSDTQQWLGFIALDIPRVNVLPFDPRWRIKFFGSESTQYRFYGIGAHSQTIEENVSQGDVRYQLNDLGFNTSLTFPIRPIKDYKTGIFVSFASNRKDTDVYEGHDTYLFKAKPNAFKGGISTAAGLGFVADGRDQETLSRHGGMIEFAMTQAGDPLGQFSFHRATVVHRHYLSARRWTLAHRLTLDNLWGNLPFWEMAAVGGIDPILDVNGSSILRGYGAGRFHEHRKGLESLEVRLVQNNFRAWGLRCSPVLMPLGVDLGSLGSQHAWALSSGVSLLWNQSLLMRLYTTRSAMGWSASLKFGQDF